MLQVSTDGVQIDIAQFQATVRQNDTRKAISQQDLRLS